MSTPTARACHSKPLVHQAMVYMMHRMLDFREAELQAAANLLDEPISPLDLQLLPGDHLFSPLRLANIQTTEQARQLLDKAVLLKGVFEVWGSGTCMASLKQSIQACPEHVKSPWIGPDVSFKWVMDGFGRKLQPNQQVELMAQLADACPFKGPVNLRNPDVKLWLIVLDVQQGAGLPHQIPYQMVVAREIAMGDGARAHMQSYALKHRGYLGPTSMDHELAFVMCNMAHVTRGSLVLDPFAGTGSILIAAAARGARVMGTDIDIRVIRDGKCSADGQHRNVYTNFKEYHLASPLGLLRADSANAPWWSGAEEVMDALVCDPPYGVRAGGRTMRALGEGKEAKRKGSDYIPSTGAYTMGECLTDLLDTAAKLLVMGGHLTYWLPDVAFTEPPSKAELPAEGNSSTGATGSQATGQEACKAAVSGNDATMGDGMAEFEGIPGSIHRDPRKLTSPDESVPVHPCMKVVSNSVQVLSTRYVRRLITLVKCKAYDVELAKAWRESRQGVSMAVDHLHDVVYEQRKPGSSLDKKRYRGKTT